jgi:hypothetical protein
LYEFVQEARADERPRDGYLVTLLRLFLGYPELLQWERMWTEQQRETHRSIYRTVKGIDSEKTVGFHIWHHNSFSPFFRAQWDFVDLRHYADWLKPVLYNNCAGARFQKYVDQMQRSLLGDIDREEATDLLYSVLGLDEGPYAELATGGWSADYVRRETARAVAGVGSVIPIYPGIDIDIPSGQCPTTREGVRDAVLAAFAGGAEGVVISRKYAEMQLDHLSGVGDALQSLGIRH